MSTHILIQVFHALVNIFRVSTNLLCLSRYQLDRQQAGFGLRQFSVRDTILSDSCPEEPTCGDKEEYYRTIDGSCNNLRNSMWGQAKTLLERILPPQYEDGEFADKPLVRVYSWF